MDHANLLESEDPLAPYPLENCIVNAKSRNICGQVTKGTWWMPWHQEPKKDVGGCDKPRGAVNRAVIRGCPNGETRLSYVQSPMPLNT